MIYTVPFGHCHINEASALAERNYCEERGAVGVLPDNCRIPDLTRFADEGCGVAAFDGNKMVGYLCALPPRDHFFGTDASGVFSPVHAHATQRNERKLIYKLMYQSAAEMWLSAGVTYHAVALYAHDTDALRAFFTYGFGLRCVDAVRGLTPITGCPTHRLTLRRLERDEALAVRHLRALLTEHLSHSPCFMYTSPEAFSEWLERAETRDSVLYAAYDGESIVAFTETTDEGENFITYAGSMKSICGAYCLPEYRGKGIMQSLINFIITDLQSAGHTLLGVDYESFNPTANAFWGKYFTAYTNSVVRRVDENILKNKS